MRQTVRKPESQAQTRCKGSRIACALPAKHPRDAAEINFTQALQAFEDFENWVRTKEALSHTKERNEESHLS